MHNSPGPDFVCIGAQKAGTTWLYENLKKHPEVWLPPTKEVLYFNRVRTNEKLLGKWDITHPYGIYNRYLKNQLPLKLNNLRWLREYYRLQHSKSWYLNLFNEKYTNGKTCGDITPDYSTLDDSGVNYAKKVLGSEIPIIVILRNPIERSWSSAKMIFRYYNKDYNNDNYSDIARLLKTPYLTLCSDYTNIITRWRERFNNVHIMTYDKLCTSPTGFLKDISMILNIDNHWDNKTVGRRVWSDSKRIPMPETIHDLLKKQYYHEMEKLYSLTGFSEVKKWLIEADNQL